MIEGFLVLSARIQQELEHIDQVLQKAESAIERTVDNPKDRDFYIDSAALNLHDFYSGVERILQLIATTVDNNLPSSSDWHRELLRQMKLDLADIRPSVLTDETVGILEEFLRFRHVLRNVYTFSFESERISQLVGLARPTFEAVKLELRSFSNFLDQVGKS